MRVLCIDRGILPIEKRVADLLGRMTLEEKARQLDLYSGTTALLNRHTDSTHAAPRALFLPDKAQTLWGNLGVGGIHDLNPTAEQANVIQKWVIERNRHGIPALFIGEGLRGFNTVTAFPAPINLAPPEIRTLRNGPEQPSQPRRVQPVWP